MLLKIEHGRTRECLKRVLIRFESKSKILTWLKYYIAIGLVNLRLILKMSDFII